MISLKQIFLEILQENLLLEIRLPTREQMKRIITNHEYKFTEHTFERMHGRKVPSHQKIFDTLINFQKVEHSSAAERGEPNRFWFKKGSMEIIAIVPTEPEHNPMTTIVTVFDSENDERPRINFSSNRPGMNAPGQGYSMGRGRRQFPTNYRP